MKYFLSLFILITSFVLSASPAIDSAEKKRPRINLRPYYKIIPLSDINDIPNIVIREIRENQGFIGHSTIIHDYETKIIKDDKVVLDHATGLMWHQSGSLQNMSWKRAKKWITELNKKSYAGFSNWRLPTLEEAVSLLEPSEKDGNQFIDTVFDQTQSRIWTCDTNVSSASLQLDRAWSVNFIHGLVSRNNIMFERKKVRPVRVSSGN